MWHNKCVPACLLNISVGIMLLGIENGLFSASFIFNIVLMGKFLALTSNLSFELEGARQNVIKNQDKILENNWRKTELKDRARIFYFRDNENIFLTAWAS